MTTIDNSQDYPFGQNNDNVTRQIMLAITDEQDLKNVVNTYLRAWQIYNNERFWVDRLEKYYPEFVVDKTDFPNLRHWEFYKLIDMFHKFKIIDKTYKGYGNKCFEYRKDLDSTKIDKDNFIGDFYCPIRDVEGVNLTINSRGNIEEPFSFCQPKNRIDKNIQNANKIGDFLYENYWKLNKEKMFSERFVAKLLLKGRCCRDFDAFMYYHILSRMLMNFQDNYNDCNDDDNSNENENEEKEFFSPEARFIFKINDKDNQVTGLCTYIDEGLID